jgi:cytochrome c-type biogenesis protein CcmF
VSRYFEGEATSEVGLRAGLGNDVWTDIQPDIGPLRKTIRLGDQVFALTRSLPDEERAAALGEALRRLVARYRSNPPPATFRLLVSPLVTWIWLGALILFGGGLIALWPPPGAVPRRVTAAYPARLVRQLRRA